MAQKIIKVGNSYAVTIPRDFVEQTKWETGQQVVVEQDIESEVLTIQSKKAPLSKGTLTPEFLSWLKKFNAKYKDALAELAKK